MEDSADNTATSSSSSDQELFSWSSLLNTFVFILAFTLFGFPILRNLKAKIESKFLANNTKTPFVVQNQQNQQFSMVFQNSSNLHPHQQQLNNNNNLIRASPRIGGISRSAAPSTPSQISLQIERSDRFKKAISEIGTRQEFEGIIAEFMGTRVNFDPQDVLNVLREKSIEVDCKVYEILFSLLSEQKSQDSKALELVKSVFSDNSTLENLSEKLVFYVLKVVSQALSTSSISESNAFNFYEKINNLCSKQGVKDSVECKVVRIELAMRMDRLDTAMNLLKQLEFEQSKLEMNAQTIPVELKKYKLQAYVIILKGLKGMTFKHEIFDVLECDRILAKMLEMVEEVYTFVTVTAAAAAAETTELVGEPNYSSKTLSPQAVVAVQIEEPMINYVIDICFQAGRAKLALKAYGLFERCEIAPSLVTYCTLIKGCGHLKQYDYAMNIYDQMRKNGIALNEVMLGCLIDTCVKCDQLERAEEIIRNEEQVKLNTIIYTTLLKGYTKKENMRKALEVFEKMKSEKELAPNIVSYNSLMECAVQCRDIVQMKEIFQEIMSQSEESKRADLITYSTYIKGLFKHGEIDEALEIFEGLRKQKDVYKLDEIFYNSILDGLFKARSYVRTRELYEKMKADNVKPSNVTFSILIKLNNAQNRIDDALAVLPAMKQLGMRPGLIVYTCLVQACIKHKRIRELKPLYEDMTAQNIRGDAVFYNTLISGFIFNHYVCDALLIAIDTLERQIFLNEEVYSNLLTKVLHTYDRIKASESKAMPATAAAIAGVSGMLQNKSVAASAAASGVTMSAEELQQYLQKMMMLMKKHSIRIEMDLYKQLINLVFVSANPEESKDKKEVNLSNSNSSGMISRANWGQNNNRFVGNECQQQQQQQENKTKSRSFYTKKSEESTGRRYSHRSSFSKQSFGGESIQFEEGQQRRKEARTTGISIGEMKRQLEVGSKHIEEEEQAPNLDQKSGKKIERIQSNGSLRTIASSVSSNSLNSSHSKSQKNSILSNNSEESPV